MKSKIQNPKSKIALALTLLALLLVPSARVGAAPSAQVKLAVSVKAGFGDDGGYMMGEWFPVRVTLVNPPGAPSMRVRVEVGSTNAQGGDAGSYAREVDLPGQSRKEVTLYAYAGTFGRAVEVRVVGDGSVIKTQQVQIEPFEQYSTFMVGVASTDASLLNVLKGERAGHAPNAFGNSYSSYVPGPPNNGKDATISVHHIGLEDVPAQSPALNSLAALVLDDVDMGTLSQEQLHSLSAWVAHGGTLIVVARPGGADISPDVAAMLPVNIEGTRNLTSLKGLADMVAVPITPTGSVLATASTLRTEPNVGARLLAAQDGVPLVAMRDFGEGQVAYLALSPGLTPLKTWDGLVPLFKRLLVEHRLGASPGALFNMGSYTIYGGYAYNPNTNSVFQIDTNLFEIAGLELPDTLLITLFLLVYILVLGPINFIILRRMRRPELAWATVPALVLVFSVGAYLIGYGSKGGDLTTIRTKIAYASPDTQDVQALQLWGLFSPIRNTYKLNIGADSVVSELSGSGGPGSGSNTSGQVVGGSTTSVNNVVVNTGSLKGFAIENTIRSEPPLEADLHLDGDQIVGTVRNRTGGGLQDVALFRGSQVQHIGYMAANDNAKVKLGVVSNAFDNCCPSRLLPVPPGVTAPTSGNPPGYYGSSNSNEQRKYNRKVHMLNMALSPLISNDPPSNMDVIALAWGANVPVSLGVDGHLDLSDEFNLWTSRFRVVVHNGDKPTLQPGAVPSWVYIPDEEPTWYSGPPSSRKTLDPYADIIFRLPAGTKPDSLGLTVPLQGLVQANIDLMAYNTTRGQWDRLGSLGNTQQSTNFVTPIPNPADYTGPAGDVTIRLMATSGRADIDLGAVELGLNK